ncbi:MAG TPA: hypothetical protein VGD55_13630 [Acidothermaceae bacterium]
MTGHDHSHGGEHHTHDHRHEAGGGPTVLDIGDDVGALVLYTSLELVGAEIEISPDGEPDRRRHVAVHPRQYPGGTAYAAVYYGLEAGSYQLWAADGSVALTVSIEGNTITEAMWPEGALAVR